MNKIHRLALFSVMMSSLYQTDLLAEATVQNQTNAATLSGYKLYRVWCARCHGTYGQGLAAPNLADSLNQLSREAFMDIVANGRNSEKGMMPAWQNNAAVMNGRENIYRYLKARSNGTLDPVQPVLSR